MAEPIAFIASVYKVQTLADGGIRVTLDLPESAILAAAALMVCQADAIALDVSCKTVENKSNGISKGQKRQSKWKTSEESSVDGDS